ncbi:MAG: TolC family protein [Saprospiraceae bacterium]|uniref:TolC family protein n=1 Tax=Candidatus Opimibacter skivensis TaxID=2982028 RepID=A0A9D7SQQ5_9BACT|nr:TolC family protein [Candidatus Opimibacter skivensis]
MRKTKTLLSVCLHFLLITFLFISFTSTVSGQIETNITLDECLKLATDNYPLAKQKGYLQSMGENNQKGINGSWLPQINFNLKATYQSEVPSFNFEGFPVIVFPKDQYSFGLQVNQAIFDGGLSNQQKNTDKANTVTEIQKNEVELYKIKEKILQLYGNILLTKENIEVLNSYTRDIESRQLKMSSSVRNGMMLQSDLDELDAVMLKTDQSKIDVASRLKMLCQLLSLFINHTVDENTSFADLPVGIEDLNGDIIRPELKLFSLQQGLLEERIKLSASKTHPKLSAFGDGAFGRPGFDFLNQKMRLYGLVGLSLTWNVSSLYNLSYDKNNLMIQQKMIDEQRELFQLNVKSSLIQQNGEIERISQMSKIDDSIIAKRVSISKTKANQLDNGTITSSDYLSELNEEKQATLAQRMHQIQLGIAIATIQITTGN